MFLFLFFFTTDNVSQAIRVSEKIANSIGVTSTFRKKSVQNEHVAQIKLHK